MAGPSPRYLLNVPSLVPQSSRLILSNDLPAEALFIRLGRFVISGRSYLKPTSVATRIQTIRPPLVDAGRRPCTSLKQRLRRGFRRYDITSSYWAANLLLSVHLCPFAVAYNSIDQTPN